MDILGLTLRRGTVYLMVHRGITSQKKHFLIVLNKKPFDDLFLVLPVITSKIEKRERFIKGSKLPENTLVRISPSEYRELSLESAVDCNSTLKLTLAELRSKLKNKEAKEMTALPEDIVKKLVCGVLASPRIPEQVKDMLR